MKRLLMLAFLCAASPAFAQGNGLTFVAQLSGFQEVPVVATTGRYFVGAYPNVDIESSAGSGDASRCAVSQ